MPGLPTLTGIGGSRGQIFLLLAVATGSFLTGRMEAMQVWGEWQQSSLTGPALWVGGGFLEPFQALEPLCTHL